MPTRGKALTGLLDAIWRHRLGLFVLVTGLLLASLIWSARGALPAFGIGLALAFVLDPVVTFVQRRGLPRWSGVLLAYLGLVLIGWALLTFAIPPLARQTRDFIAHLPQYGSSLSDIQHAIDEWYRSLPLPDDLRAALDQAIARAQAAFGDAAREILGPAVGTLLRTVGFVVGLVVVPVWLFFVLKDRERFPAAVAAALPPAWREDADNVLRLLAAVGGRWVRGQLLLGIAVFAATAIGLVILTLVGFTAFGSLTLVLALIAGLLEWFPIIGPIVSAIPAILVGLTISPAAAIAAVILFTAIQQLENNLLVPKVLGDAVQIHPAVLIVALVVGGSLFGIGGAILAAPITAAGRDLYRYTFDRLHGLSAEAALAAAVRRSRAPVAPPPPELPAQTA
jgi:predicted PurR-regulated permease PerM